MHSNILHTTERLILLMPTGVYTATKKDGSIYYRTSLTFHTKHISLGSFSTEEAASNAYIEANRLLNDETITIHNFYDNYDRLSYDKVIVLLNFRDNHMYFNNPIYLRKGYFSYFLSPNLELKFDNDDLFYYSSHRILKRQGHLYVNDYGMQYSILGRYGIKPYSMINRDYMFANGDETDYRYANIIVINRYHGVQETTKNGIKSYETAIHINGNYKIGSYSTEEQAAIAYNKAADFARSYGIKKEFPQNYIDTVSPKTYADIYSDLKISKRYLNYLKTLTPNH